MAKLGAPAAPTGGVGGQESDDDKLRKEIADILSSAKASGFKASLGSREVRGEWIVLYDDSDAANGMLKKWKEKDWIKDEEKDPPRYWKSIAQKSGGGKTAPNVLRDGLAFRQSGMTFSIRTSMDVNLLKNGLGTMVTSFVNTQPNGSGGGRRWPGRLGGQGMSPPGKGPRRRPPRFRRLGRRPLRR